MKKREQTTRLSGTPPLADRLTIMDQRVVQDDHRRLCRKQRELVELLGYKANHDRFKRWLREAAVVPRE